MKDSRQYLEEGQSASVSPSLLGRLQTRDADAWHRVLRLYTPLVHHWCHKAGLQAEDAADVAQEVFRALAGNVERFDSDGGRYRFRNWLFGITQRQILAFRRKRHNQPQGAGGSEALDLMAGVAAVGDESSVAPDSGERPEMLRRALALLREGVEERTFQAFWRATVEGHAPADIAADLGMSVNSVYIAKTRLLRRLRVEFGDLL